MENCRPHRTPRCSLMKGSCSSAVLEDAFKMGQPAGATVTLSAEVGSSPIKDQKRLARHRRLMLHFSSLPLVSSHYYSKQLILLSTALYLLTRYLRYCVQVDGRIINKLHKVMHCLEVLQLTRTLIVLMIQLVSDLRCFSYFSGLFLLGAAAH